MQNYQHFSARLKERYGLDLIITETEFLLLSYADIRVIKQKNENGAVVQKGLVAFKGIEVYVSLLVTKSHRRLLTALPYKQFLIDNKKKTK